MGGSEEWLYEGVEDLVEDAEHFQRHELDRWARLSFILCVDATQDGRLQTQTLYLDPCIEKYSRAKDTRNPTQPHADLKTYDLGLVINSDQSDVLIVGHVLRTLLKRLESPPSDRQERARWEFDVAGRKGGVAVAIYGLQGFCESSSADYGIERN